LLSEEIFVGEFLGWRWVEEKWRGVGG